MEVSLLIMILFTDTGTPVDTTLQTCSFQIQGENRFDSCFCGPLFHFPFVTQAYCKIWVATNCHDVITTTVPDWFGTCKAEKQETSQEVARLWALLGLLQHFHGPILSSLIPYLPLVPQLHHCQFPPWCYSHYATASPPPAMGRHSAFPLYQDPCDGDIWQSAHTYITCVGDGCLKP